MSDEDLAANLESLKRFIARSIQDLSLGQLTRDDRDQCLSLLRKERPKWFIANGQPEEELGFLDIVDCDPDQVLDVSRWNGRHSTGELLPGSPGSEQARLENYVFDFGKHRGQSANDPSIPDEYFSWMLGANFKGLRRKVAEFQLEKRLAEVPF